MTRAALKAAHIWDAVESRLVHGENIAQTAQFVQTGNADAGIIALSLEDGDAVAGVSLVREGQHVVLATAKGMAIRFPMDESAVRRMGRTAFGVIGIRIDKGDVDAGAVLGQVATLNGNARLYGPARNGDGEGIWLDLSAGSLGDVEADVDGYVRKRRESDPDLWVIELEDRQGRTLLEEEGLRD